MVAYCLILRSESRIDEQLGAVMTFEDKINIREVVARVQADGYCFLEGLLDPKTVNDLNAEFAYAFQRLPSGVSTCNHPPGRMATIDSLHCSSETFPTIFRVFFSSPLKAIAGTILPKGSVFNK